MPNALEETQSGFQYGHDDAGALVLAKAAVERAVLAEPPASVGTPLSEAHDDLVALLGLRDPGEGAGTLPRILDRMGIATDGLLHDMAPRQAALSRTLDGLLTQGG